MDVSVLRIEKMFGNSLLKNNNYSLKNETIERLFTS
jgi:hypothetical protein